MIHVRGVVRTILLYIRTDMGYVSHAPLMPFPLVSQRAPRRMRCPEPFPCLARIRGLGYLRANMSCGVPGELFRFHAPSMALHSSPCISYTIHRSTGWLQLR